MHILIYFEHKGKPKKAKVYENPIRGLDDYLQRNFDSMFHPIYEYIPSYFDSRILWYTVGE